MKYVCVFIVLGFFVVMFGYVIYDVFKFGFLFFIFYILYVVLFWMVFSNYEVEGYFFVIDLFFSMFRMIVVDEYNYDGLLKVKFIMVKVFCGIYIVFLGVICLNLFIVLMFDIF